MTFKPNKSKPTGGPLNKSGPDQGPRTAGRHGSKEARNGQGNQDGHRKQRPRQRLHGHRQRRRELDTVHHEYLERNRQKLTLGTQ